MSVRYHNEIKEASSEYIDFMQNNKILGSIIFAIIYTLSIPLWVPSQIFMVIGSYLFARMFGSTEGFILFVLLDFVCIQLGSLLGFLNSRYLFRTYTESLVESRPKLKAISSALSGNTIKLVALLRMSPAVPNYFLNCV